MADQVKAAYVARFRPGLTREQAGRYWTDVHAPMADGLRDMVRYVQSHVTGAIDAAHGDAPDFDGYACEWWRDRASFEAGMRTPQWREIVEDGPKVFDASSLQGRSVVVRERVVREGPTAPYKLAFFVRFKDGLDPSAAARHWLNVHGPLALRQPEVVRYVQNLVVGSIAADGAITPQRARFDGLAELWFEDEEAWRSCHRTPAADAVDRDRFEFLDMSAAANMRAAVAERVIKPR